LIRGGGGGGRNIGDVCLGIVMHPPRRVPKKFRLL
jgi:hypothetical protein